MEIRIVDIINTNVAVTTENGNKVFNLVDENLKQNKFVEIDFSNIETMTTAFLNSAIGQLYSRDNYDSDFLNEHISISNFKENHFSLIIMVIERAKEYFADKKSFEKNLKESLDGDN